MLHGTVVQHLSCDINVIVSVSGSEYRVTQVDFSLSQIVYKNDFDVQNQSEKTDMFVLLRYPVFFIILNLKLGMSYSV